MFRLQTHPFLELLIRLSGFFRNIITYGHPESQMQSPLIFRTRVCSWKVCCVRYFYLSCHPNTLQFLPLFGFSEIEMRSTWAETMCNSIPGSTSNWIRRTRTSKTDQNPGCNRFFPQNLHRFLGIRMAYPPTAITYQPSRTGWNRFGGNNLRDTAENHRKPRIAQQLIFCLDACCLSCLPGMTMWTKKILAVGALGAPTMDSAFLHSCTMDIFYWLALTGSSLPEKLRTNFVSSDQQSVGSSWNRRRCFEAKCSQGVLFIQHHPTTNLLMEFPCEVSAPNGQQVASRFLFAWSSNDSGPPNVLKPPTSKEVWVGNVDGVLGTNRSIN